MRWSTGRLVVAPGAAWALAAALGCGCAADEESPCRIVPLPENGEIGIEDPLAPPLTVTEVRRVICLRGIVPCADERVSLRSTEPEVLGTYRDTDVAWVFYVVGRSAGRATITLCCATDEEHSFDVEVR